MKCEISGLGRTAEDQIVQPWYAISNPNDVPSPALLFFPERIVQNIESMLRTVKNPDQLRPHVKTHKCGEVIRLQLERGIRKYKCATIAEAELLARCGAPDILLAYQPVGPNQRRWLELMRQFPASRFSTVLDDEQIAKGLSAEARAAELRVPVLLDVDCGMGRTGAAPDDSAVALYQRLAQLDGLTPAGLHAYDGHIHDRDPETRAQTCAQAFAPVRALRDRLRAANLPAPMMVAGGTPTFPIHAQDPELECSPGTTVLWDAGYQQKYPDLDYLPAAVLLARVVSRPGKNRLCLDLGHKAVAAENPHPRAVFFELPDAKAIMHSEEHLVLESARAAEFEPGAVVYGLPWHICPTVALHAEAVVVENQRATSRWRISARDRSLTI